MKFFFINYHLFDFRQLNLFEPLWECVGTKSFLKGGQSEGLVAMDQTLEFGFALTDGNSGSSLDAFFAVKMTFRAEKKTIYQLLKTI